MRRWDWILAFTLSGKFTPNKADWIIHSLRLDFSHCTLTCNQTSGEGEEISNNGTCCLQWLSTWCAEQWFQALCSAGRHPERPTWQRTETTHLCLPSPSSHRSHGRSFPWQQMRQSEKHATITSKQNNLLWCVHLLAGQVSNVDEGVIERSEDVTHTKHVLSFGHLRTQADHLLLLLLLPFTRSHCLKMDGKTSRRYTSLPLIRQLITILWNYHDSFLDQYYHILYTDLKVHICKEVIKKVHQ